MDLTEHYALPMALVRVAKHWPEPYTIQPGLENEISSPAIREVVERSPDRGGALAYFLILAARAEALQRSSVPGGMPDIDQARTAAEFIINGEIQRLNERIEKKHSFTPFPIPEWALIHNRFSSGEFSVKEVYGFLEAMQPIAAKAGSLGDPGKEGTQPAKQQVTRGEWINGKIAAQTHLNAMGRFYARNHYGRQADRLPQDTFVVKPPDRGERFRHCFEKLHENKLIYHERFTAVVEITGIELAEEYFQCDARVVQMCTEQSPEIEPWTFRARWEDCSILPPGRGLSIPYASFILWPGAKLVREVEALLDFGDFETVDTLLWSDLPTRRNLR
jgi:hypothetical protein